MNNEVRFSTAALDVLTSRLDALLSGNDPAAVLGAELSKLASRIPSSEQVTPGAIARLALLNDVLCVAERAMRKDGSITEDEVSYIAPLAREAHKYLSRVRSLYRETIDLEHHGMRLFLEQHARDTQQFGGSCRRTAWQGLSVCERASQVSGDGHYLDQYRDLVSRTIDELFDSAGSGTLAHKRELIAELAQLLPQPESKRDPREVAYCASDSMEVFHAVSHGSEVFDIDPFDVETIHADARLAFSRLLDRAPDARSGRILLIKGEAGSGKTHLMRAFRNQAHGEHLGFVAYMQMSTRVSSYSQYILSNLIDSWDRPYWGESIPEPTLMCLSEAVARDLPEPDLRLLRDEALAERELHHLVNQSTDSLLAPMYGRIHVDVLRMMLYLQRREPARRARVLKFLRCEPLNAHDRAFLGDASAFTGEEAPAYMLEQLGRLVALTGNRAFVLLVDQLEDIYNLEDAASRFRLAMDSVRYVTDHVPSSVVVVACLEDFYAQLRAALAKPMLERIELDPDPIRLTAGRSYEEIEELVGLRLRRLFEHKGALVREEDPLFPFKPQALSAQVHHRTRDVLDWCRMHHESSVAAGHVTEPLVPATATTTRPPPKAATVACGQAWNDFRTSAGAPPEDEPETLKLLHWAMQNLSREYSNAPDVTVVNQDVYIEISIAGSRIMIALCERSPQGGHLGNQIAALGEHARSRKAIPVAVRSSEYPAPGKTKIAAQLKTLLQSGGRRIVVTDSEWRFMGALRSFCEREAQNQDLDVWLKAEQPLSSLTSMRAILDLESLPLRVPQPASGVGMPRPASVPAPPRPVSVLPPKKTSDPSGISNEAFKIGQTRGLAPHSVLVNPSAFVTHAAFLGSSGSGKTTLALAIIENLLVQGVPALMIDRKGDLCTYAQRELWNTAAPDSESAGLKERLVKRLDVRIYTPGDPRGRPLALPVVPSGLGELPTHERGIAARHAASALGAMMGYRRTKTEETRLGILGKAIELVSQVGAGNNLGIGHLVSVLDAEDPELVAMVGKLDTKHFRALVENLETLRLRYEHLVHDDGESLSPQAILGVDSIQQNRTRLSIVSTKFLGDNSAIDFWVARMLGEFSRWASRSPADHLQAVLFLDEADIYLPALSKPATKEPMLDLLKRARSAGLGVFLATQSPGDLDYRCRDNIRTWFVGRVAEKTAVEKMKPLLNECRVNVSTRLASAKVGEFFKLQDGDVAEFKAQLSLLKTSQLSEDEILRLSRQNDS